MRIFSKNKLYFSEKKTKQKKTTNKHTHTHTHTHKKKKKKKKKKITSAIILSDNRKQQLSAIQ